MSCADAAEAAPIAPLRDVKKQLTAKPGDTFEQLAKRSSIKRYPVETLRLLNGDAPLGEPTPGDYIKIVQ